jgi:hypothetical protein
MASNQFLLIGMIAGNKGRLWCAVLVPRQEVFLLQTHDWMEVLFRNSSTLPPRSAP